MLADVTLYHCIRAMFLLGKYKMHLDKIWVCWNMSDVV